MEPSENSNRYSIATIAKGVLVASLLIIIIWIIFSIEQHMIEHLNGFWVSDTIDGQCILYLDDGSMRLIESRASNDTSSMKQCSYTIASSTWWNLNMRTYAFQVDGLTSRSKIGQQLKQTDLKLDLYPIEGTCIIYNDAGDILTLIKDNKASVSLLV